VHNFYVDASQARVVSGGSIQVAKAVTFSWIQAANVFQLLLLNGC